MNTTEGMRIEKTAIIIAEKISELQNIFTLHAEYGEFFTIKHFTVYCKMSYLYSLIFQNEYPEKSNVYLKLIDSFGLEKVLYWISNTSPSENLPDHYDNGNGVSFHYWWNDTRTNDRSLSIDNKTIYSL